MGRRDFPPFFRFLEGQGLGHYAELLYNNNFSLANFDRLTEADLRKLHITGTKEIKKITDAARYFQQNEDKLVGRQRQIRRRQARHSVSDVAYPEFTATLATANECARQATVFLAHQRVDRQWPRSHSTLAQALNLSTAAPTSHDTSLYTVSFAEGDTSTVHRPCRHEHGHSAKFCGICADHISDGINGQWQFQSVERVHLGGGTFSEVPVWKPFDAKDNIRIEFAYKKKEPGTKIRGRGVVFSKMKWGERALRRMDGAAVPFPTLADAEIVAPPEPRNVEQQHCESEIQKLYLELLGKAEGSERMRLAQEEAVELSDLVAWSTARAHEIFADERAHLERLEEQMRAQIEYSDLDIEIDAMWTAVADSVRAMELDAARREGDNTATLQRHVLENMEAIAREDIEAQEVAMRENLRKLGHLLNEQMHKLVSAAQRKRGEADAAKNHGGLRCPICRKPNCVFFRHKWRGQWAHRGGALDLKRGALRDETVTLSALVGRSNEAEYHEYVTNQRIVTQNKRFAHSPTPQIEGRASLPSPIRELSVSRPRSATPSRSFRSGLAATSADVSAFRCSKRV